MARVYFKVHAGDIRKAVREKGTKQIIALSKNPKVMKQIAEKAIDLINPYVPEDSGALRESAHVIYHEKQVQIVWGDNLHRNNRKVPTNAYARYQYGGEVYGPNIPIRVNGVIVGWRSPKDRPKYPTGRSLNYKSPNARSHWTEVIKRGTSEFKQLVDYAEPLVKKEVRRANK